MPRPRVFAQLREKLTANNSSYESVVEETRRKLIDIYKRRLLVWCGPVEKEEFTGIFERFGTITDLVPRRNYVNPSMKDGFLTVEYEKIQEANLALTSLNKKFLGDQQMLIIRDEIGFDITFQEDYNLVLHNHQNWLVVEHIPSKQLTTGDLCRSMQRQFAVAEWRNQHLVPPGDKTMRVAIKASDGATAEKVVSRINESDNEYFAYRYSWEHANTQPRVATGVPFSEIQKEAIMWGKQKNLHRARLADGEKGEERSLEAASNNDYMCLAG